MTLDPAHIDLGATGLLVAILALALTFAQTFVTWWGVRRSETLAREQAEIAMKARRDEILGGFSARREAIEAGASALEASITWIESQSFTNSTAVRLPRVLINRVNAAIQGVGFYLRLAEPMPSDLVTALAMAEQILSAFRTIADTVVYEDHSRRNWIGALETAVEDLKSILDRYAQGTL